MAIYDLYSHALETCSLDCMTIKKKESKTNKFIRDLCNGKSEAEILEAEQNFQDYLLVVKEICDRYEREGKELPSFDD